MSFRTVRQRALLFSPVVIVIVTFFAAIPWMEEQDDTFVMVITAAAAIFVMGYSLFIANRLQRDLDEVQIASQGFASSRGWTWGAIGANLLLLLPPVTNGLIDLANVMSTGSADTTDRGTVHLALFFGLMLVVLMQLVAVFVAAAIWERRMSAGADPS